MTQKLTRPVLGSILLAAAAIALGGAALLETLGLGVPGADPLSFVGTVVFLKLGLFAFWPDLTRKGREAGAALRDIFPPVQLGLVSGKRPSSLALWDQRDPRLDVSLFSATVPTFVLSQDQRFLDWNPAFNLAFGGLDGVRRGAHVSHWFKHLDNFRRVPKRTDKLYGEGILPITDRERVAFLSSRFGRMVFTKIMSPIIDRGSGRIIGWTVVLNINSVNKREDFFTELFAAVTAETKRIRFAASYDGLFDGYAGRQELLDAHRDALGADAMHILDVACGTGQMTMALLAKGRKVTAVEGDIHRLRRLKDKAEPYEARVRLVRQDLDALKNIPSARYDGAVLREALHRFADPGAVLALVFASLKPGAILSLSLRQDGVDPLFNSLKSALETSGRFDNLKHQFNHVLEYEREQVASGRYRFVSRDEARALLLEAGFALDEGAETDGLQDGHTLLLRARKP